MAPVNLLKCHEDTGMFALDKKGMAQLQQWHDKDLIYVVVMGAARSGKSYVLNHLAQYMTHGLPLKPDHSNGFKMSSEPAYCTKGMQIWGEPIPLEDGRHVVSLVCA